MTNDKPTTSASLADKNQAAPVQTTPVAKAAPKKAAAQKAEQTQLKSSATKMEEPKSFVEKPANEKNPAAASQATSVKPVTKKAVPAQTKSALKAQSVALPIIATTESTQTEAAKPTHAKSAAAKPATKRPVAKPAQAVIGDKVKAQPLPPAKAKQPQTLVDSNPSCAPAPKESVPSARKRKLLPSAIEGIWKRIPHFIQLMRLDKPIGILLLLWPTLWALWLAAKGMPSVKNLIIFCVGVVVMRSAGCVINDFADRKIDSKVTRTQGRPLATGVITRREALILFVTLCVIAFGLVLLTDPLTIKLSLGGLLLAVTYPFMKRYTHLPQVVLGAAFAWGIPMAYAAQTGALDKNMWLIYFAVVLWTVVYDTFYAMVDRDDDLKIGVKSTAILFGDQDRVITGALQILTLYALYLVGSAFTLGWTFYLSLIVAAGLFSYQQWLIRFRERQACFKAFLNNNWVGAAVFVGIALDLAVK